MKGFIPSFCVDYKLYIANVCLMDLMSRLPSISVCVRQSVKLTHSSWVGHSNHPIEQYTSTKWTCIPMATDIRAYIFRGRSELEIDLSMIEYGICVPPMVQFYLLLEVGTGCRSVAAVFLSPASRVYTNISIYYFITT